MSYSVIIPAAGSGSRMGASVPKVLLRLGSGDASTSILRRSVEAFSGLAECACIIVCAPPAWRAAFEQELQGCSQVVLVDGGATRQESVRNGLTHLVEAHGAGVDSVVLVHDAARCCVSADVINRVVAGVRQFGAAAAAVRVVDSVCRAPEGVLGESVERAHMWALQTPQGFLVRDLQLGHEQALQTGVEALHDAQLVAPFRAVQVVEGDRFNIKVTEPSDLAVAEAVLTERMTAFTDRVSVPVSHTSDGVNS
jgi:2-C-methyl-D-erythritol 4-phosphate cytidylyltransferase